MHNHRNTKEYIDELEQLNTQSKIARIRRANFENFVLHHPEVSNEEKTRYINLTKKLKDVKDPEEYSRLVDEFNQPAKDALEKAKNKSKIARVRLAATSLGKESIEKYKKIKKESINHTFDPSEIVKGQPTGKIMTFADLYEKYGGKENKPLHIISSTNNTGEVDLIEKDLDKIGSNHLIGSWNDGKNTFIDASYPLSNATDEQVQEHLQRTNQQSALRIFPDLSFDFPKNKHLHAKIAKHYIHDPYTPREYGRDDTPNLLDQVSDDVEQHAGNAGKKMLDNAGLHPKSYSKIADVFDHMTRDTLLRVGNNYGNDFEHIQGKEHEEFTKEAADVAESGKFFHRKNYGMENPDEIKRPKGKAEEIGEALMEPFRRQKEQEMADVPREDFITGNRLIEKFSRELYGKAYKSLKSRGRMLGAKITNLQQATGAGVHAVIDKDGNLLEKDGSDHFDLAREHLNLQADTQGNRPDVTDEQVHQMLRDNDFVRVQNFTKSRDPHISVHLAKPANQYQMKKIKEIFEDNPYISIGYFMGHTADSASFGGVDSFNEFRLKHTEAFAGKPE